MLIIFEKSDYSQVQKLFESEGKFCRFVGYSEDSKTGSPINNGFFFSKIDLTLWGFPKTDVIQKFLHEIEMSDILIDFSTHNHLPLSYLISLSKVKLKVGIKKEGFNLYDFMLDAPKIMDFKFLSEQIMFYLRKLKSQRSESDRTI